MCNYKCAMYKLKHTDLAIQRLLPALEIRELSPLAPTASLKSLQLLPHLLVLLLIFSILPGDGLGVHPHDHTHYDPPTTSHYYVLEIKLF